jgi:RNA polymerase sigma-70 factor (ECF subfamily)
MAAAPTAENVGIQPVPDTDLIERVQRGDQGAFETLYERYFPRVFGFVQRRLDNRADTEETVQEVFLAVFSSLDSYRGDAPFGAWVLGVSRRTVASRFKKKRCATVSMEGPEEPDAIDATVPTIRREPTPLEHYECEERLARIEHSARESLSEEQRLLFELHHLRSRPIQDIARLLRKSEDAVKSNLYRARRLLLAH